MGNTKSALKNARKTRARTLRNRHVKSRLKTLERQFQACLEGKDEEATRKASAEFISALDRAAKSSIIHENKAARKKSACSAKLALDGNSPAKANQVEEQVEAVEEQVKAVEANEES